MPEELDNESPGRRVVIVIQTPFQHAFSSLVAGRRENGRGETRKNAERQG